MHTKQVTGSALSLRVTQASSAAGFIKCCKGQFADQLTINFKLVIQGHSTPGSTAGLSSCQ